eukprot:1442656-Lingulodinium_polyedra.AAC.1
MASAMPPAALDACNLMNSSLKTNGPDLSLRRLMPNRSYNCPRGKKKGSPAHPRRWNQPPRPSSSGQ